MVVVVVASLAVGGWIVSGAGGMKHTVTGTLALSDSASFSGLSTGDSCYGEGGYDDMHSGAQVVVEDETGKTLGTGELGTGTYDGSSCDFAFSVAGVSKASFYRVSAGNSSRTGPQYSFADLSNRNWQVSLTLGD